ncbi:transglycosylase SLT domain-containing protein [Streptacidiphilus fuscans]|uniref:Transglycosylase SLT domain-containing protein n=1 Tax=Streptacidiphilus fuscans TaxID=2789292 RepID=A0A931FDF2_9ACTN|nr:transglycosylase SLT domain-containing protein [Streptacidiphilus fuscans]MBF9068090.1 transglycosylase SLT domain-containing protein [Streptacidiphilus fuscans]
MRLATRTPARLTADLIMASAVAGMVVVTNFVPALAADHSSPAPSASASAKADAKAGAKTDAKPDAKTGAKTGAKADAKPDTKTDAKAAPKKDAKPAPAKPAAPAKKTYPNNLNGWIAEAQDVLRSHGDQVPPASAIYARAMTESSGNPDAQNHWDGNQALYGGTYGLLQTIKPTFAEWSLPGHKDILNPVDSIIAGVRYANDRYGSFTTIAYTKAGY